MFKFKLNPALIRYCFFIFLYIHVSEVSLLIFLYIYFVQIKMSGSVIRLMTCVLFAVCMYPASTDGELFTALADMEELLQTESVLITTLQGYITAQERKLELLRRYHSSMQSFVLT